MIRPMSIKEHREVSAVFFELTAEEEGRLVAICTPKQTKRDFVKGAVLEALEDHRFLRPENLGKKPTRKHFILLSLSQMSLLENQAFENVTSKEEFVRQAILYALEEAEAR
jgi:hypothetical protein